MMKNEELSEVRRILCNGAAIASGNSSLDLKFISSSVIKRWMVSQDVAEISLIVEEIVVTYSKLSTSQRHESRFDAPKLFLQVLFTMEMFSNLAVLAVCLRFLTDLFKDNADLFAFSVDLVLPKLLPFLEDQRLIVRSATCVCLGNFISGIPFSAMNRHLRYLVKNSEEDEEHSYSDSRIKLVIISLLALYRDIEKNKRKGITDTSTEFEESVSDLTKSVVLDIFDLSELKNNEDQNINQELQCSKEIVSAVIDLVAATSLILCPSLKHNYRREGLEDAVRITNDHYVFPPKFVREVLTDSKGILRVELAVQQEIQKRAVEKCMLSLSSDKNFSLIADNLLLCEDDMLVSAPTAYIPLVISIPTYDHIDSLTTTTETNSTTKSHLNLQQPSSNCKEISPLKPFSPSSSYSMNHANSPMDLYDLNRSVDEEDVDMDRSKLSALKKSQSRGGSSKSRQQRLGGLTPSSRGSGKNDFFSNRSDDQLDRLDDMASINNQSLKLNRRSRTIFSYSPSPSIGSKSDDTGGSDVDYCSPSFKTTFPKAINFADISEEDGNDELFDQDYKNDYEENDLLALSGESFLHGHGARTAGEMTSNQRHGNSNNNSLNIHYPQTPVAIGNYDDDGQRTQGLIVQGHNPERTNQRFVGATGSQQRENRLLLTSPSLPNTKSPPLHGNESGYYPSTPDSRILPVLSGLKVEKNFHLREKNENFGVKGSESPGITTLNIRAQVLRSPTNAPPRIISPRAAPSAFSVISSPIGIQKRTNIDSNMSESKTDSRFQSDKEFEKKIKSKGRFQSTREQETDTQERSSGRESGGGMKEYQLAGETFEYLSTDEILPSTSPQKDIRNAMNGISTHEWPEIFHTLTTVRRLSLHHSALLIASNSDGISGGGGLHSIVLGVLKQVENLRSAVAKNALLTLGDLFQGLGRAMDLEVSLALTFLLKRFGDSNSFLVDSAERALQQMMDGVTASRSLTGLLTATDHRTAVVRGKVASLLYLLWTLKLKELRVYCVAGGRDQETIKIRIGKLVSDQTPEARTASRNIVRFLVKERVISKTEWEPHISVDQLGKILAQALIAPIPIGLGNTGHLSGKGISTTDKLIPFQENETAHPMESPIRNKNNGYVKNKNNESRNAFSSMDIDSNANASFEKTRVGRGTDKAMGVNFNVENDDNPSNFTANTKKAINIYANNSNSKPQNNNDSGFQYQSIDRSKKTKKSNQNVSSSTKRALEGPELQGLPDFIQTVNSSSSWTDRQDALKAITGLLETYWEILLEAGKLDGCVDCLLERLEDGSVKVVHCALSCLTKVQTEVPGVLGYSPAMQLVVISALHSSAASSNRQISATSSSLLSLFISSVPLSTLIPHLCSIALHEKERQRVVAFKLLADLMKSKSAISEELEAGGFIKRVIFPACCQCLFGAGNKGDVRVAAGESIRTLQRYMLNTEKGQNNDKHIWTWLKDSGQQEEIKRLTASVI